jgi:hypothetical protein
MHMAELKFHLYERPRAEVAPFISGNPPRWVLRVFQTYGADAKEFPASAVVEALGETIARRLEGIAYVMRKAENRGWLVELTGDVVSIESMVSAARTRELMEEDGVWDLACRYLRRDPSAIGS